MDIEESKAIVKISVKDAVIYCGTQLNLAKKTGISQGAISKYLRGETLPMGRTARRLSSAVDGTISKENFAPHIFYDEVS